MMLKNTAGPTIASSSRRHWPLQSLPTVHCFLYTPGRITHSGTHHLWLHWPINVKHPACPITIPFLLIDSSRWLDDKGTAERCGVGYEPKAAILRLGGCLALHPGGFPRKGQEPWILLLSGSFTVLFISPFLGCFSLTSEFYFSTFLNLMKSAARGSGHF